MIFILTLLGRMLSVSKRFLAIQQDEEQPAGSHAADGQEDLTFLV